MGFTPNTIADAGDDTLGKGGGAGYSPYFGGGNPGPGGGGYSAGGGQGFWGAGAGYNPGFQGFGYQMPTRPVSPTLMSRSVANPLSGLTGAAGGASGSTSGLGAVSTAGTPAGGDTSGLDWSWLLGGGGNSNDSPMTQFIAKMLGTGGQAGYFDPNGSSLMNSALWNQYNSQAGADQAGMRNYLQAGSLDNPNALGLAGLQGDMNLARSVSGAQGNAYLQNLMGVQDWYRNLMTNQVGQNNTGNQTAWNIAGQRQLGSDSRPNSGLGGILGGALGTGLGSWLGQGGGIGDILGALGGV